jgi:hypothetical protein
VAALRRKLGAAAGPRGIDLQIVTLRGHGYRLEAASG